MIDRSGPLKGLRSLLTLLVLLVSCSTPTEDASSQLGAELIVLSARCKSLDFAGCDELAANASATVELRALGASCGGLRESPGGSCLDLLRPTTTLAGGSPGCISRGDQGDEVRDLQQRLNALGANPLLAVDGTFGPRTEAALGQLLGGALQLCRVEELLLSTLLEEYSRVPDVRRLDKAAAEAQFTGPSLFTVTYSERCSASVSLGAVVAVQYARLDGVPLIVFDAERPTDSATTLAPTGTKLEVVVSTGPCPLPELAS